MAIAIALVLIVVGSIIFHFWSPWTLSPLASNWGNIDVTILITLIITAIVFIAINIFMAYAIVKFRYKEGRVAKYEPENKKLEIWLTVITSVGIIAMLAPGLIVYAEFVNVPDDAMEVEVVGQQWSWGFRFPGADEKIGKSAIEHITVNNPFGLAPLDGAAQDDILVNSNRLLLPIDQPVKLLMRSKDVLHDFYVPQFRVKMDMVPGTVSYIWFTPTKLGEFEILCAEFCGVGHFNMRGYVEVVTREAYDNWLSQQATFAQSVKESASSTLSISAKSGEELSQSKGCMGCHNFNNSSIGPTWAGLLGKTQSFVDGSEKEVNEAYLREAILDPTKSVVKGFAPIMPTMPLTALEVDNIIAYIKEKGGEMPNQPNLSEPVEVKPQQQVSDLDGKALAQAKGCIACHTSNGDKGLGPTWKDLYGTQRELVSGQQVKVDDDYLLESMFQPNAKIVKGFPPVMPPAAVNPDEAMAIINYIKTL